MTSTNGRHAAADQNDVPFRPRYAAIPPSGLPRPDVRGPIRPSFSTTLPAAIPPAGLPPMPPAGRAPWTSGGSPPVPPAGFAPMPLGPAPRPAMRWGWLAVGVVLAILAVGVLVSFADAHRTTTVSGTVTVYGMSGIVYPGSGCYDNAYQGTPVSIYDASGDLVGTSSLPRSGTARNTWGSYSGYSDSCELPFTATDVSTSSDFYRVAVGSGQSQGVSFSRAQLESGSVAVTVH